jgi:hypothetical protein
VLTVSKLNGVHLSLHTMRLCLLLMYWFTTAEASVQIWSEQRFEGALFLDVWFTVLLLSLHFAT